jgi:cytochrome c oxidase cbb3-type subunit 3
MSNENKNPPNTQKTEAELDLGHNYDGIRELDNQLPDWWLWSFYITVIFSIPYVLYYHVYGGPTLEQECHRERETIEFALAKSGNKEAAYDETKILTAMKDPALQSKGKQVFMAKCASCHGNAGQGGIGPNLADEYWLHGGKPVEIAKTIDQGVLDKGMPGWRAMMSAEDSLAAIAFIASIQGTKPAGAKGPQGVKQ